jgi:hypothetical protein
VPPSSNVCFLIWHQTSWIKNPLYCSETSYQFTIAFAMTLFPNKVSFRGTGD